MTSLFFNLRNSALVLLTSLIVAPKVHAQASQEEPVDRSWSYMRVMNLCPPETGPIDVQMLGEPEPWQKGLKDPDITGYGMFRPGTNRFKIIDTKTGKEIESPAIKMSKDTYHTLRIAVVDGEIAMDVQNDTYAYRSDAPGNLRIINSMPGLKASGRLQNGTSDTEIPYLSPVSFSDISGTTTLFLTTLQGEREITFEFPLNFKEAKRQTVLILPDRRGRPRPSCIFDGYSGDIFGEPADTQ